MREKIPSEPEDEFESTDEAEESDVLPELVAEEESGDEVLEEVLPESPEGDDSTSDTSIRLTDFERNVVHIAGHDMYVYNFKEQGIKLSPLTLYDADKVTKVFVKSDKYTYAVEKLEKNRFLILSGQPHTGKYSMALQLAIEFAQKQFEMSLSIFDTEDVIDMPVQILRLTEDTSLVDFLEDVNCPDDRVFIVHDAFVVPRLGISEIERHGSYIRQLLEKSGCFAILTTDTQEIKNAEIPDTRHLVLDELDQSLLSDALTNHLNYYSVDLDAKELTKALREKVIRTLVNAYNIDRFAGNLSREQVLNKDSVERTLTKTANIGLDAKIWFNGLDPNEKYYALLIGLCPDLEKENLWDLYDKVLIALQSKKVKLAHALNYPEGELIQKTNSHLSDVNSLEFDNMVYREFVLEQVRVSYAPQFTYLSSVFADLVITNKDVRDVRIALASALGEIGKSSWKNYENLIHKWALNPDISIRSGVAHSLRQLASSVPLRKEIFSLLKKWSNSGNYRVRWTVAACCERLYSFMPEQTLSLVQKLSGDDSNDVRNAVAHALVAITKQDLELTLDLIVSWATGENQNQKRTAVKTFWRLINESKRISLALRDDQLKTKLLPLIEESCVAGNMQLYNSLSLVKSWILIENKELERALEISLLSAYERSTNAVKSGMYDFINREWDTPEDDKLYRFAVVLLDRIQREKITPFEFYVDKSEDHPTSWIIEGDPLSEKSDDEEKSNSSKDDDDDTSSSLKGTALGLLPN